jgi:hypothetical protein
VPRRRAQAWEDDAALDPDQARRAAANLAALQAATDAQGRPLKVGHAAARV